MQLHRGALGIRRRTQSINTPETLPFRMAHREFSMRQKLPACLQLPCAPFTYKRRSSTHKTTKMRQQSANGAARTNNDVGTRLAPHSVGTSSSKRAGASSASQTERRTTPCASTSACPPSLEFAVTIVTVLLEPVLVRWIRRSGPERLPT